MRRRFFSLIPVIIALMIGFILSSSIGTGDYVDIRTWPVSIKYNGRYDFYTILLFCAASIVFVDTIMFTAEAVNISQSAKDKGSRPLRLSVTYLIFFIVVCNAIWLPAIAFEWIPLTKNEYVVFFLFFGFVLVELVFLRITRGALKHQSADHSRLYGPIYDLIISNTDKLEIANMKSKLIKENKMLELREYAEVRREYLYYRHNLYYVDLPVVLSMLFIFVLTHNYMSIDPNSEYWNGMASGALLMHILMSQIVFIIVSYQHITRGEKVGYFCEE